MANARQGRWQTRCRRQAGYTERFVLSLITGRDVPEELCQTPPKTMRTGSIWISNYYLAICRGERRVDSLR